MNLVGRLAPDATRGKEAADATDPGVGGGTARADAATTPVRLRRMRAAILATTLVSCVTAVVVTLGRHETAVSVRDQTAPALLGALEARAAMSDADRAVWASFRSGEAQLLGPGQEYQDDITIAGRALARLASVESNSGAVTRRLEAVNGQLVNYQGLVGQADATNRGSASGDDTLGYAYLTYASRSLRDPHGGLLAAIGAVAALNRERLSEQEHAVWTSQRLLVAYGAVALAMLACLLWTQRFVRRRFRRAVTPPLALATAVAVGISVWVAVAGGRANQAYATAHDVSLSRVAAVWHRQTRGIDGEARALRSRAPYRASRRGSAAAAGRPFGGLDIAASNVARRQLTSKLDAAADTGGLVAAVAIAAGAIAGLTLLGLGRRIDEYRE